MKHTNPWVQTHTVNGPGATFPVMREGHSSGDSFYSPAEWEACVAAYWTLDPERGLLGGGQVIDGSSFEAYCPCSHETVPTTGRRHNCDHCGRALPAKVCGAPLRVNRTYRHQRIEHCGSRTRHPSGRCAHHR